MTTTPNSPGRTPTRRSLLGATLAAGAAVPLGLAGRASAATGTASKAPAGRARPAKNAAPAQILIPPPTGPYRVGKVDLHLIDPSRTDPFNPGQPYPQMASLWYPARDTGRFPVAQWTPPDVFAAWVRAAGFDPTGVPVPVASGHVGAPVLGLGRPRPIVLFLHGAHDFRADTTTVVQELVSHGYLVATIDHTGDAITQFPGGPVLTPGSPRTTPESPADFALDAPFLLDSLARIAAGHNPDADRRPLPEGLPGALDLDRVGLYGWSKGGTATVLATIADPRIRAGLALDGPMEPTITTDLAKPFMMMSGSFTRSNDPDAQEFWTHLTGWRRYLQLDGAEELAFTDTEAIIGPAAPLLGLSQADVQSYVGTMDTGEGVRIQQAYPRAFFDLHLRDRPSRLLDGPSPEFPSVRFFS